MEADFSQPQRQSIVGIVVMFFDTIRNYARAFWPILLVWVVKSKDFHFGYIALSFLVFILIFGVISYLKYWNFTFYLDHENEEFVINSGVLSKTRTTIKLNKIQQVHVNQSFLQQLIGVYALDVDTAGTNKTEVAIQAISHPLALALKARLLENDNTAFPDTVLQTETETFAPAAHPFVKISFLSLLKVGITSNYVRSFGLLLAFFFSTIENIKHIFGDETIDENKLGGYFKNAALLEIIPLLIMALFVIILVMNVFRIVFNYFNFKITKQSGSLLLSFGLLNTKNTIIKPARVQIATVSSNYFQKKLNILEIKIKQATSGEKEERKAAIEIPGCNASERDAFLQLLFHQLPEKGVMLQPNYRKLGFALFLSIGLPVGAYYGFKDYLDPSFAQASYVVWIYAVLMAILQYIKFRNYRLFINDHFIIKQSGAWDISHEIFEPSKIQAITTSQLFWHKSLNIGSVTLHTAGGSIAFHLGNFDTIKNYINLWLYEMETSNSNWM